MSKLMFQFRDPQGKPALDAVRQRFGFTSDEVDSNYGVVAVDPDDHLYVVLVDEAAQKRVSGDEGKPGSDTGYFSNPKIEPFGPPES